jgi:hypothetical protein
MHCPVVVKGGVSISSLKDVEILFSGIPSVTVTISMTINSPAPNTVGHIAVGEKHGVDWSPGWAPLQNDILKEYIAQKEHILPPRPSMRLMTDDESRAGVHFPRGGIEYADCVSITASPWTTSLRASVSSLMDTTITSRKSRSTLPRAKEGERSEQTRYRRPCFRCASSLGIFHTHPDAPRVLITNSNLLGPR